MKLKVGSEINREKLKELLKETLPELNLDDAEEFDHATLSFAFSIVVNNSRNMVEAMGKFELMKMAVKDFADSKEFGIFQEKRKEAVIKQELEKRNKTAG